MIRKVLVYGDTHFVFHDPIAIDLMFAVADDYQPDTVIINGDLLDCYEISDFDKTIPDPPKIKHEIEAAKQHLERLRDQHPDAHIVFNEGNHDHRMLRYLATRAPAMADLYRDQVVTLLELERFRIFFNPAINRDTDYDLGHILVGHWNVCRKHSAFTAKALVEEFGTSVLQGHVHRMGSHYKTWKDREVVGYEGGCLCNLQPVYMGRANWQQGFCFIDLVGDYFKVTQIPIVNTGERAFAIYGGKMYEQPRLVSKGAKSLQS